MVEGGGKMVEEKVSPTGTALQNNLSTLAKLGLVRNSLKSCALVTLQFQVH